MKTFHPQRLLIAGTLVSLLTACSGGGSQLPAPPSAQAPQPQSAQRLARYADTVQPSSTARSVMSLTTPVCTPVATSKGPLTAAVVPTGEIEHKNIDASGCDIGVYLSPSSNHQSIEDTKIHDANQYGVFADQAQNVSITHSKVYKIGNHDGTGAFAPNGLQTGVGLYFRGATGRVDRTDLYQYQKNGTAFNCLFAADDVTCLKPSRVSITHSTATGLGQVNYIAQNGIQYDVSTAPEFEDNKATNNSYLNPTDLLYNQSATGFLFLCTNFKNEDQLRDEHNIARHNDINYFVDNNPADC